MFLGFEFCLLGLALFREGGGAGAGDVSFHCVDSCGGEVEVGAEVSHCDTRTCTGVIFGTMTKFGKAVTGVVLLVLLDVGKLVDYGML